MPLHRLRAGYARMTLELAPSAGDSVVAKPPPREFRIFAKGSFKSLNTAPGGRDEFFFDEEAAKLVMERAARKGTDFVCDYEHQSMEVGRAPAAGYFKLELRNGELWAVQVEWTEQGANDLMPGRDKHGRRTPPAYRYFSPVFGFDPKTGRVTSLISLGLTNTPATRDMQALAASHRPSSLPSPRRSTTFRTPGAPARGKYMEHKMGKNQNQFASAASFEALETLKSAHADAIASLKESQASLSEANDQLKGEIASLKADSAMHQATAAAHATTLKAKDEEIASLKAVAKDVAGIVGKDSLSDAKGAFAALKQEAAAAVAKAAELTAKFEKLESDAKVAKLSQLVDQGITEGRFVPAEREHLIKQDASFVEEMLKIRPVIAKMSETKQPDPAKPPPALEGVDPELQAAMKAMGHDPAAIAASLRGAGALQQVVA